MPRTKRRDRLLLSLRERIAHLAQRGLAALHASVGAFEMRQHIVAEDLVVPSLRGERRPVVVEQEIAAEAALREIDEILDMRDGFVIGADHGRAAAQGPFDVFVDGVAGDLHLRRGGGVLQVVAEFANAVAHIGERLGFAVGQMHEADHAPGGAIGLLAEFPRALFDHVPVHGQDIDAGLHGRTDGDQPNAVFAGEARPGR